MKQKILRITAGNAHAGNAPYNQFSLPVLNEFEITFVSLSGKQPVVLKNFNHYPCNSRVVLLFNTLKRLLKEKTFDVVHIHNINVFLVFLFAQLVTLQFRFRKTIFTLHTSYYLLNFKNKFLILFPFFFSKNFISCSKSSFDSVPKIFHLLFSSKFDYITNGFDENRVMKTLKNLQKEKENDQINFITIGRLIPGKKVDQIIDAFNHINNEFRHLTIVGEGPLEQKLKQQVTSLNLSSKITFTGKIPREEVYERLFESDIFISASIGEGLPIAVLESISIGCIPVLSDIPPHSEILSNFSHLKSFQADRLDSLKKLLEDTIANLENLLQKKEQMSKIIMQKYSLQSMLAKYISLYKSMSPK